MLAGTSIALAALLAGHPARAASGAPKPPGVRLWTKQGEAYRQADRVQVFFSTERDAYVTVLRVDTDGRVRVLFPAEPGDSNFARGGETYTVAGPDHRDAFIVDDPPGVGYIFAVASRDPFAYDAFTENDHWSLEAIASSSDGRIQDDPNASLQNLVQQIMLEGYADYDTQLLRYDVDQRPDSSSIALAPPLVAEQPAPAASGARQSPGVFLWTNHGEVYQQSERVQVFFRTDRDAYVTVLRVDTDGRVRVLFPPAPGAVNLAHGGETYAVPGVDDSAAFIVNDPPGLGYVFAVASQDPFAYDAFTENDRWNLQAVASLADGRIHGDPNTSLQDLVQQIMPEGYADYDTHLLAYDVELRHGNASVALAAPPAGQPERTATVARQQPYDGAQRDDRAYDAPAAPLAAEQSTGAAYGARPLPYDVVQPHPYPRFLCYDCHAYTPYASWNPYSAWCPQFSLSVYDNPFYSNPGYGYASRYYGGTNVVYAGQGLTGPQYVFRTRADQGAPYAVYRNRAGDGMQQPPGHGVRGTDLGGVGSVPAPGGRRTTGGGNQHGPGDAGAQRHFITGSRQEDGRRGARDAAPGLNYSPRGVGPSREYIGQAQPHQRGIYIGRDARGTHAPSPTAISHPDRRESPRYIPQGTPRQGSRGTPGYGASQGSSGMRGYGSSQAPRSGYAPRGGAAGSPSPAQERSRQRLVYIDPGTRQRNAPRPSAIGRPEQRESQRYVPQAAPRQGSRDAPGYGASRGPSGMRGYGASPSRAPRSGYEPRGGGRGSSSSSARSAPRAESGSRSAPTLKRRRR
jgi:hypothetical protein